MRTSRYMWSERFMPWMGAFAVLADAVSENRHALSDEHPLMAQERKLTETVSNFWEAARKLRDAAQELNLHDDVRRITCDGFFVVFLIAFVTRRHAAGWLGHGTSFHRGRRQR